MRLPTRKSETERLMRQEVDNFVTPTKIANMSAELLSLRTKQRGPAAEEVARLAQMGDLSENAGYQFAKQNLRRINDRITMLEERLKQAIPIRVGSTDGVIRIGSSVTVKHNQQTSIFQILGSSETNPLRGRISHSSPLGQALLGHRIGERVAFKTPSGQTEYEILQVE